MEAIVLILILLGVVGVVARFRIKDSRYMDLPYSPKLPKNLRPRIEGASPFDQSLEKAFEKVKAKPPNSKDPS